MTDWMPIGSAPKDGTHVDLACRSVDGGMIRLTGVWWSDDVGWRRVYRDEFIELVAKRATHWASVTLPEPPNPS